MTGKGGSDLLKGGGGRDELDAHDNFELVSNSGEDTVIGGFDDDPISRAGDGFRDIINCGAGFDRVLGHDEGLDEIENCEIVFLGET